MIPTRVCFEPWGMGDALIAATIVRERPAEFAIACHPAWIPILKCALNDTKDTSFLPVELHYTTRARASRFTMGDGAAPVAGVSEVLSIRGDPRDLRAARRLFPGARVRVSGWIGFLARRNALADLPFRLGLSRVMNRYDAWTRLAGISFATLRARAGTRRAADSSSRHVAIHVGAQWRSRQYPQAAALKELLEARGWRVTVLACQGDQLPPGISESHTRRVKDGELVTALQAADVSVTNDSGPMHLSAFLGCRTLALARVSNIDEWVPPGVAVMAGARLPRGYRPDRSYTTDSVLTGWPEPVLVADRLIQLLEAT